MYTIKILISIQHFNKPYAIARRFEDCKYAHDFYMLVYNFYFDCIKLY